MIKSKEVKTFLEKLYCDECQEEMKPTGRELLSYPPQYPHICFNGHETNLLSIYPKITYKEE